MTHAIAALALLAAAYLGRAYHLWPAELLGGVFAAGVAWEGVCCWWDQRQAGRGR